MKSPPLLDVPRFAHGAAVGIGQALAAIGQFGQLDHLNLLVKFLQFFGGPLH